MSATRFNGTIQKREPQRYEIRNVPSDIRNRDRVIGRRAPVLRAYAINTEPSELLAMAKVMATERLLGFEPRDVSAENRGYDIESRDPSTGHLRFIEVKGRVQGAPTITVTKNEILTALNKPEAYILAIVLIADDVAAVPVYVQRPFTQDVEFGTASVNFHLKDLLSKGKPAH